jgi:hypothetical protein
LKSILELELVYTYDPLASLPIQTEIGYNCTMATVNIRETLLQEVSIIPTDFCPEVLCFIESLKAKRQPAIPETMLLSEAALSKDWDTEEEDDAWASL